MGFKITVEMDVDRSPDGVGEALRSLFFDEKVVKSRRSNYRETGCYSTFDWQKDVEPLPVLPVKFYFGDSEYDDTVFQWTRGQKNGVECRWYWDGDGTLVFKLPDGRWLTNTDCKKNHGWFLTESEQDFQ